MSKNEKKEQRPKPPTLEEVVKAGYELRAAHAIVAEQEALLAGLSPDDAKAMAAEALKEFDARQTAPKPPEPEASPAPAKPQSKGPKRLVYRIKSPRPDGFCRLGRRFTQKAVDIPANSLTAAQVDQLLKTGKTELTVDLIEV